jgi:transcriptional regulator with XRE-family HTH domain
MEIQKARQRKQLTQKDLADLSNLPIGTIRAYEKGTAVPNPGELNAMGKVLGITLSNKKK